MDTAQAEFLQAIDDIRAAVESGHLEVLIVGMVTSTEDLSVKRDGDTTRIHFAFKALGNSAVTSTACMETAKAAVNVAASIETEVERGQPRPH